MRKTIREFGKRVYRPAYRYWRDVAGNFAIMFALSLPIMIGASGMAIDMGQAYLVQERLRHALDAAALAGAASSDDPAEIQQRVQDFFDANYPPEKLGIEFDPVVQVVGDEVQVTGNAYHRTSFLRVIGVESIDVRAETIVQREVQGLEVALVLDNTGSMSSNDNITSLKEAATLFINTLFDNTSNPQFVRVGLVPYSNSVRVGSYGLGEYPDGTYYDDPFVTLPADVSVTNNHNASSGWYGCVVEHNPDDYDENATYVSGSRGQLWKSGSEWNGHGWDPSVNTNDPYPYDVLDNYVGPWDIYQYGRVQRICEDTEWQCVRYWSNGSCREYGNVCVEYGDYVFDPGNRPNEGCPYANIVPLTSDRDFLLDQVDPDDDSVMYPHGNTLGNIGMVWGGRVISPEAPFREAHAWDSEYWKKAIVMMTDGDNTENGTYSSFWATAKNQMNVTKFNQRFAETCEDLKAKGVTIYTITFTSNINETTRDYYRDCADSADQYYDAPTQQELIDAFESIARELSNLHIKG